MKPSVLFLVLLSRALAGAPSLSSNSDTTAVTITVTRTHTTCPIDPTVGSCDTSTALNTRQNAPSSPNSGLKTFAASSTTTTTSTAVADGIFSSGGTTLTRSTPSTGASTSTSTPPPPPSSSTSSSTPTTSPTLLHPGRTFTPSATLTLADINIAPSVVLKRLPQVAAAADLTVPVTVYVDSSTTPAAAVLTLDPRRATSFVITPADATLTTTLRSYPYVCGATSPRGQPARFGCDDSGAVSGTLRGWTDSPAFAYRDWVFCYTTPDLGLYLARDGPTGDCREITFTVGEQGDGVLAGLV